MPTCSVCGTYNQGENNFCANCGTGLTGVTGHLSPHTILEGRYIVLETLGRGGMGAVYKALDQRLGKVPVAVKEMSSSAVKGGDLQAAIESFKKEASILVNLRHNALPRVTDFFSAGKDRWYLVMDYIEGKTLKDILKKRGPIPESEVLDWARQLCEIIYYLHNQTPPVIFRDLKPSNIMLTPEGKIKLIDFGIARNFSPGLTSDTSTYGSPGYSPPEQHGQRQTDARSDIYALGATLHHLITGIDPGKNPFFFEQPGKLVSVSPEFESAIMKALELKPENRPDSIKEMISLLPAGGKSLFNWSGPLTLTGSVPTLEQSPAHMAVPLQSEDKRGEQPQPEGRDETEMLTAPWWKESEIINEEPEDNPETFAGLRNTFLAGSPKVSSVKEVPRHETPRDASTGRRPGWIKAIVAAVGLVLLMAAGAYGYIYQNGKGQTANSSQKQTAVVQTQQQQTQSQQQTQQQEQPSQYQQVSVQDLQKQKEELQRQQEELQKLQQNQEIQNQQELQRQQQEIQRQQELIRQQQEIQRQQELQRQQEEYQRQQEQQNNQGITAIARVSGQDRTIGGNSYIKDGRVYVPLQYTAQALGITGDNIILDAYTQSITIINGDRVVKFSAGSNQMLINGVPLTLDAAPEFSYDGQIMVPIRWFAEAMGITVSWDSATQTVVFEN